MEKNKNICIYEHYYLYREFPEDKRGSRSPSKIIKWKLYWFLEEELESNSNLMNNAII